ncbi:unnamed protein product [Owenia fusiformis]|uniref:Uncharacterized protein n=1 Tax=Owenia fusiformis TaxID=6347 RepID=A0A8J1XSV8_OWEFU|nr:unnamed protein product [Owenia fusiformis]
MCTMKAIIIDRATGELSVKDVEKPEIKQPSEVLVKVKYSGICGSDLGSLNKKTGNETKCILGHEVSGIVEEIGAAVHDLKVGDPVCVSSVMGCGSCGRCSRGRENLCDNEGISTLLGYLVDGGMTAFIVSKRARLFLLPSEMPLDIAALSEPFATAYHPLEMVAKNLDPEVSKALVIGCGPTGMAMAFLLHYKGFKSITVVQRSKPRRDALLSFDLGIDVLHPDSLISEFETKNGRNDGFDFIFDTSGTAEAINAYFPLARKGGDYCIFGLIDPKVCLDKVNASDLMMNEINILGSNCFTPTDLTKTIDILNKMHQLLDLSKIGINLYPIERYEEGFTDMQDKKVTKVMFEFNV